MKIFSTSSKDLRFGSRLVPSFYYYSNIVKKEITKKGTDYICLGDHSTISDGEHSAIPRNSIGGIRYLYGRNIKEDVIDFDPISDDPYIYEYDYENFRRCHIKENDVLIAIYGTVGKSAVYRSEYVGVAGIPRHIANISIKEHSPITPEYLVAFFRSKYGKRQMYSLMTGNIQQLLSLKNLREFEVPVLNKEIIDMITEQEQAAIGYEIESQKLIKKAIKLFYDGLNFDVKSVERDFTFTVSSVEVFENNVWSTSFYDKLYVKMAEALRENNETETLRTIVDMIHGDEVGSDNYAEYIERSLDDKAFIRTSDIVNNELDLYPDYYISPATSDRISQDIKAGDVIFTKDGKIGCVAMITEHDNVIISSGLERLRLKKKAIDKGLTQEYLFVALAVPEVGQFGARRRTVIASTIPHLRVDRMKEIEIPIEDKTHIDGITELVKEAFRLRDMRKMIIKELDKKIDGYFDV